MKRPEKEIGKRVRLETVEQSAPTWTSAPPRLRDAPEAEAHSSDTELGWSFRALVSARLLPPGNNEGGGGGGRGQGVAAVTLLRRVTAKNK